jgi:stage II sporulation protein D
MIHSISKERKVLKSLGLILFIFINVSYASVPQIRILLGKKVKSAKISGVDLQRELMGLKKVRSYKGYKNINLECAPLSKYSHVKKAVALASYSSNSNFINYNNHRYTGSISLVMASEGKGCNIINNLSIEDYIRSVLPKEMNGNWPIEALKAQAIAARSYAYYKIQTNQVSNQEGFDVYYDLENSERHQVNGNFFDINLRSKNAQLATSGEILFNQKNKNIPIFFHSKCGGKTKMPSQIWRNQIEGYSSVNCPFCHKHGKKNWEYKISDFKFSTALNKVLKNYYDSSLTSSKSKLKIIEDSEFQSKITFYDEDKLHFVQKSRISNIVGRSKIPSSNFLIKKNEGNVLISGKGFGHGVGLCQFGAYEMAKQGYTYKEILKFYFPKLLIKKIY